MIKGSMTSRKAPGKEKSLNKSGVSNKSAKSVKSGKSVEKTKAATIKNNKGSAKSKSPPGRKSREKSTDLGLKKKDSLA